MPSEPYPLPPDVPSRTEVAAWLPAGMADYFPSYDALQAAARKSANATMAAVLGEIHVQFCRAAQSLHDAEVEIGGQVYNDYCNRYSLTEWPNYLETLRHAFSFDMTTRSQPASGTIDDLQVVSACLAHAGCVQLMRQLARLLPAEHPDQSVPPSDVFAALKTMRLIGIASAGMQLPQVAQAVITGLTARSRSLTGLPESENLRIVGKLAYDELHGPRGEACLKDGKIDRPVLTKLIKGKLRSCGLQWRAPRSVSPKKARETGRAGAEETLKKEETRRDRDWLRTWTSRHLAMIGDDPVNYEAFKDYDLTDILRRYQRHYFCKPEAASVLEALTEAILCRWSLDPAGHRAK